MCFMAGIFALIDVAVALCCLTECNVNLKVTKRSVIKKNAEESVH